MAEEGNKAEIPYFSAQDKIALRNSWLKIGVVSVLTVLLSYKLAVTDFSKIFENFEFSDLLSLLLALFSIALSVLFYLKATETSNVFYNNTYRFTKDVSEILGRVESGFGERLKHLDDGYIGLKSAVENIPFDRKIAEEEIKEEERLVEKFETERNKIIEDLAIKAQLDNEEMKSIIERLNEQDNELSNARKELYHLKNQLSLAEINGYKLNYEVSDKLKRGIHEFIIPKLSYRLEVGMTDSDISAKFSHFYGTLPKSLQRDLRVAGLIGSNNYLNEKGISVIKSIYKEINS